MKKAIKYLPFNRKSATISNGAYGLIAIKSGQETILVNENGIFGKDGKRIHTKVAKKMLGLD